MADELATAIANQQPIEPRISMGAVAFLDILGFKGMWQSTPPDSLAGQIGFIAGVVRDYQRKRINDMAKASNVDIAPDSININLISDTFLISVEHTNPAIALFLTTQIAADLITQMALFNLFKSDDLPYARPIFLRGAISYGWFYRKDNMYIGEAIDDAAEWFTQPEFIGAILTPRTGYYQQSLPINNSPDDPSNLICKYLAQTKNGNIELFCVDWIRLAKMNPKNLDALKAISLAFSFHGNIAPVHLVKYRNTELFIKHCLNNHDKNG